MSPYEEVRPMNFKLCCKMGRPKAPAPATLFKSVETTLFKSVGSYSFEKRYFYALLCFQYSVWFECILPPEVLNVTRRVGLACRPSPNSGARPEMR